MQHCATSVFLLGATLARSHIQNVPICSCFFILHPCGSLCLCVYKQHNAVNWRENSQWAEFCFHLTLCHLLFIYFFLHIIIAKTNAHKLNQGCRVDLSRAGNRWFANGLLGKIENTEKAILQKVDKRIVMKNALCIFKR